MIIDRPAGEVFDYLSDPAEAQTWRADLVESSATPPAPVKPGMVRHEVAMVMGRRIATDTIVDTVTATGFTFSHADGVLPMSGEVACTPGPQGTIVAYTVHLELHGRWVMFARYLRRSGDLTMALSLANLRRNLEAPARRVNAIWEAELAGRVA